LKSKASQGGSANERNTLAVHLLYRFHHHFCGASIAHSRESAAALPVPAF
jgi:hypothetical protein